MIWGLLIYKIVDAFSTGDKPMVNTATAHFKAPTGVQKDTFSLKPIVTDPFLGTVYAKERTLTQTTNTPRATKNETPWPSIGYFGIVADRNSPTSVYIVSINGQQFLLKQGDTLQKLKIIKGSEKNIFIRFGKETREFPIM
jgi:type II secretory pathway component PulC